MKKNKLEIIAINANDIRINPDNAKIHPDYQIEQIISSIEQFGFNDPIAVDEDTVIIEGHGRYYAAKKMGLETVPAIRIEGLTAEQKTAYSLIHNKTTMNTGFDVNVLKKEIAEIVEIDMSEFSFNLDMDGYFDDIQEPEEKNKRIIVTVSEFDADNVRNYLNDNDYKFKEHKC